MSPISIIAHLRGRNLRKYSSLDSGVFCVGVFLLALVRAFFGGVWTVSVSFVAAVVILVTASSPFWLSVSMGCSSFFPVDFLPFGVAFCFFEALGGGGEADASRFFVALAPLRGVGVFDFRVPAFESSSSLVSSDRTLSGLVSLLTSVVLLPEKWRQRNKIINTRLKLNKKIILPALVVVGVVSFGVVAVWRLARVDVGVFWAVVGALVVISSFVSFSSSFVGAMDFLARVDWRVGGVTTAGTLALPRGVYFIKNKF